MRKLVVLVFGVLGLTLLSATSAFAQSDIPPPEIGPEVVVPPGAGAGTAGTAFTGTDIAVWMVVVAALFVLGVGFLITARRRARSSRA